jgi:hypothetical protein
MQFSQERERMKWPEILATECFWHDLFHPKRLFDMAFEYPSCTEAF